MERKRGGTKVVGGVTKGGGIDIGFNVAPSLKKGLISREVLAAAEGTPQAGGVWGGLGGACTS